jgi:hypothetical protein
VKEGEEDGLMEVPKEFMRDARAVAQAHMDRAWAEMESHATALERILLNGPMSQDADIVYGALKLVADELTWRRAERERIDKGILE